MIVRALRSPAGEALLKSWICQQIGSGAGKPTHFHVIYQTLAGPKQEHVEARPQVAQSLAHGRRPFDRRPDAFARFITVGPIIRIPTITVRVLQFQTASSAARPSPPSAPNPIGYFIHHSRSRVHQHDALPIIV